jgi:hypothetical protein
MGRHNIGIDEPGQQARRQRTGKTELDGGDEDFDCLARERMHAISDDVAVYCCHFRANPLLPPGCQKKRRGISAPQLVRFVCCGSGYFLSVTA